MNIRGREINIWKWLVLGMAAHKAARVAHALIRLQRLAKKNVRPDLEIRYSDL